jgi:hypothetical protein
VTQQPLVGMESLAIRQPSVEEILFLAVDKGAGIDAIERLAKLKCELDDRKAQTEFNAAMNRCQSEIGTVKNDKDNKQTSSRYATYAALDRAIRPIYTKHGFSVSYSTAECPLPDHIRMIAYVSLGGYTRQYQTDEACDGKGPKGNDVMTKTHAKGSAHMYGKRNLLRDIFNLVTGDEVDDDGNAAGNGFNAQEHLEWIANAKDLDELKRLYFQAKNEAGKARNNSALRLIEDAKNARKAELL